MADYTVDLVGGGSVKISDAEVLENEGGMVFFTDENGTTTGAVPMHNIRFIRKE